MERTYSQPGGRKQRSGLHVQAAVRLEKRRRSFRAQVLLVRSYPMTTPPRTAIHAHMSRRQCWCGNVAFEFHGDPVDAKHCHCKQCQHLHGAPFQWAVIFPKVCLPPLLEVRALSRRYDTCQTSVRMVKNENDSLHFFSTQRRQGVHDVPCKA